MRSQSVRASVLVPALLISMHVGQSSRGTMVVSALGASGSRGDQLVVTLGVSANGTVSLLGQEVATGRVLARRAAPSPRAFVAVLSTDTGDTLEAVDFDDPTVALCRGLPDGGGDANTGEQDRLESGVARVAFAFDARARRVKVLGRNEPVAPNTDGPSSVVAIRTVAVLELGALTSSRAALPPYTTETLLMNGDSENRLDIVFLGDGYRASELGKFRSDVVATVDKMASTPPYDGFMPLINVHLVNVVSNDSGIDDPAAGIDRDTGLDLTFKSDGVRQSCVGSKTPLKVFDAASLVPEYDEILVIANDTQRGGCATAIFACFTASANFPNLGIHEFGHSFAFLGDEYGGSVSPRTNEPSEVNATIATSLQGLTNAGKWDYWVTPGIQIPSPLGAPGVGLFEGALVSDRGVYRPASTCAMRDDLTPFCPVCVERIVQRLHELADPIESFSSSREPLTSNSRVLAVTSDDTDDAISPAVDIRGLEVVQAGRELSFALRLGETIEDPYSQMGPITVVVNTPDAFHFMVIWPDSRRLVRYDFLHGGSPTDVGIADFSGATVSAHIPLDVIEDPSTIDLKVDTHPPEGGNASDSIHTGPVSITPLDELFMDRTETVTLQGRALSAAGANYGQEWTIDGTPVGSDSVMSLSGGSLGAGVHLIEFRVEGSTPYVRRDPQQLLVSSHKLAIAVCGTGPAVRSASLKLAGDGKLIIRGRRFEAGSVVQINGVAVSGAKRVKASGTVLTAKGPLANGLPLSSIALQGERATVLVISPDGGCTVYSADF